MADTPAADKSTSGSSVSDNKKTQTKKEIIVENIKSLGFALLIVLMLRSSIIEPFKIPSGSMIPTLFVGDHIFVNKFAYGLSLPLWDFITGKPLYIIKRDPPKRGDIIVFRYPRDERVHYIKRVVGVAGDTIEVKDMTLYLNGQSVSQISQNPEETEKVLGPLDQLEYRPERNELFKEKLGEIDHWVLFDKDAYLTRNHSAVTVREDHVFVMGDNRDKSNDSRFWGQVPLGNIKGKAMVIWLSTCLGMEEDVCTKVFSPNRMGTLLK